MNPPWSPGNSTTGAASSLASATAARLASCPFDVAPGGDHDACRCRAQRRDVGPEVRGGTEQVGEEVPGRGAHPGHLFWRRLPAWCVFLLAAPGEAGVGQE